MIVRAIRSVLGKIRHSRIYYQLFIADIDCERLDQLKTEARLKYGYRVGWY
jgi:hypothetical protein